MLIKGDRIRVGFDPHEYEYGILCKLLNEDIWGFVLPGQPEWSQTAVRLKLCSKINRLEELLYF